MIRIYKPFLLIISIIFLSVVICVFPHITRARDTTLQINIYGPGQRKINMFVIPAQPLDPDKQKNSTRPNSVLELQELLSNNLDFLPFIQQDSNQDIIGAKDITGLKSAEIDFKRFKLSHIDLLMTIGWQIKEKDTAQVEIRIFDVFTNNLLLGKGYIISQKQHIHQVANQFSASLMQELTGKSGFFKSEIAFVKKDNQKKEIFVSTPQGYELKQLTDLKEVCLSPTWSWDGSTLAFTSLTQEKHELILWNREDSQLKHIFLPGNTIISPAFKPGNSLAISVDPHGNPDIYYLNSDWELDKPIIQNWAIDISPDFDKSGQNMVFVSSRLGNPHIFLYDINSAEITRISYEGTYNTNPSISPNGRYIAYSRLTERGHRIIVYDRKRDEEKKVTFGPGNDEDPDWGPDGYFLAFASSRSGKYKLYLTNRHGDFIKKIPTGKNEAKSPAWGPAMDKD